MPKVGQRAVVTFPAPPSKNRLQRSIFVKASGYYDIHIKGVNPARPDILDRIVNEPGYVVKYSLGEYFKYRDELVTGPK